MSLTFAIVLVVAIVALGAGWLLNSLFGKKSVLSATVERKKILDQARQDADNEKNEKLLEVEEELYQRRDELEEEFRAKKRELQQQEQELIEKDSNIDRKGDLLAKKESELGAQEREISTREQQVVSKQERLSRLINEQNEMLEKIAGLTAEEARKILMDNLTEEARESAAKLIHTITEEAKSEANKKAQNIVLTAIQQIGMDITLESTVSVVTLPSDDMKGRIIGREGRNIRAFEVVTGVDVIVDDTPGSIILSAYDPLRREIARIVMEKLVADGRIHPGRIEDMHEKIKAEMNDYMRELGEQATMDCSVHGIHSDLVYLLGKLRYRTSFGQNVLQHSKEVAMLAGMMAAELGLDVNMARRAGILHDIGRAVERVSEGNHAQAGFEVCKKYNEHPFVLNAIAAHHGDIEPTSPIAVLVQTANEISKARPGARREVIENFITRLIQMEEIANSFDGVLETNAIQAGKEIRVIVSYEKVDDARLQQITQEIAQRIENEVEHPGQIKVVVIREYRGVDFA